MIWYSPVASGPAWVFFGARAKPTFMQRSLAERMAEQSSTIFVDQAVSLLRKTFVIRLPSRVVPLNGPTSSWCCRPLHFPQEIAILGALLRKLNKHLLRKDLDRLLPPGAKRIILYDSPSQHELVGALGDGLSVYLAIDDRTVTVWGEPITGELEAERKLLSKVDLVICVSEFLACVLRERSGSPDQPPIHVLANGYEEKLFDPSLNWPEPDQLYHVPRPRVLISGHLSERLDWEGIIAASHRRPKWTWVFVGPADRNISEKISRHLGGRARCYPAAHIKDIPAWICHCDACAVPYRLNGFTRASSPVKALEYLAMGKPVLSTRIPALDRYGEVIEWVEEGNGESYAAALDRMRSQLTNSGTICARRASVRKDSWAMKAQQFKEIVSGIYRQAYPACRDGRRSISQ